MSQALQEELKHCIKMLSGLGTLCLEGAFKILFLSITHTYLYMLTPPVAQLQIINCTLVETLWLERTGSHHLFIFCDDSQSVKLFKSISQRTLNNLTQRASYLYNQASGD